MAQILPRDQVGYRRLGTHACALVAVVGLALVGAAFATPASPVELRIARDGDSESNRALPAQVPLPLGPLAPMPLATVGSRTQGADQIQALAFDPRRGLPQWLRTTRDTPLWSGADLAASTVGSLPAGDSYVKPLGGFIDTRVQVYFPGDEGHAAAQAWVDTANVEPSAVPAWVSPTSLGAPQLPAAPRRTGDAPPPDTTAIHIAIIDDASGQLIYGEQPNTEVPQASTTKIATTIVALERSPDVSRRIKVTISATAMANRDGSSTMGIEPGRSVSLDTLLHGMMLPSGNDAAEQVAVALADSREQYVDWMNLETAALGLKNTHFVNPSGMDAPNHYSSAYDMAMLARYAMRNSVFRDLAGTSRYTSDGFPMANLNRFLDLYPGADGVKIGFTDAAQKTIVASATRDGHHVYVSLMHSQDLVGDCTALFNWVWDNFAW
ncbi:MAG TPA: D-alanyl-D-alanine carboxypeptidase family protein [Chloroflexota bacterium]|nr:D-alanyl-D-alanine carboxypeptidase family protein [Chloroflexota bacterium]